MEKMTLYSRVAELEKWEELFESCIDEETGEIIDTDVLEVLKNDLEKQIVEKSSDVVKYHKNRDGLINQVSDEIKRLQAFKKALTSRQENFEKYILYCMEKLGKNKIETANGTIKITKSQGVKITDYEKVPAKYIVMKQEFKEDLRAIAKAIKSGEIVDGAILEDRKNISIK